MSKFNVGDRVRVLRHKPNGADCAKGELGVISAMSYDDCRVKFETSGEWYVTYEDLELLPTKTHTVTIPEDREVTGVETKEDHIRVNLKKKIEVGKWYQVPDGRWGQRVKHAWPCSPERALLKPLGPQGAFWEWCDDMTEIEPFEEILQVLDVDTAVPQEGDLYWHGRNQEWRERSIHNSFLPRELYARKRKVLKAEFSGGQ